MDKNLKSVLVFTMVYGLFAVAALSMHPKSASLRIADGFGKFDADADAQGAMYLVLANAE